MNKKKIKKRKIAKRSRKEVHEFVHFRANKSEINVSCDEMGRLICPEADPESVCVYKGYIRDSRKEKIVSKTFAGGGKAHFSEQNHILANFDSIAAIDTNNYRFMDRNLSISAPYYCKNLKEAHKKPTEAVTMPFFIIENVQPGINPEVVGWHLFIKHIVPVLRFKENEKLALIVDSELGKLEAINNRKLPYYSDYLLPENIALIYASADTGDGPLNKLIKECDKSAKIYFLMIQEKKLHIPDQLGGKTADFSGYVYVNHEESEYKITG